MSNTNTTSCDHCEGDYQFEIESPDYSVGIMGYTVFLDNTIFDTHDDNCPVRSMTQEELDKIEHKIGVQYNNGEFF